MNLIEEALKKEKHTSNKPPRYIFGGGKGPGGRRYIYLLIILAIVIVASAGTLWYLSNQTVPVPTAYHPHIKPIKKQTKSRIVLQKHRQPVKKQHKSASPKPKQRIKKPPAKPRTNKSGNYSQQLNEAYNMLNSGNLRGALSVYMAILNKDPKQIDALINSGIIYYKLGYVKKAEKTLLKALKLSPKNPEVLNALGVLYMKLGNYRAAERYFNMSNNVQGIINLGILNWRLGKLKQALRELKEAVKMEPDSPYAHYYLGLYYAAFGNKQLSQEEFTKAELLAKQNGNYQLLQEIISHSQ